MKYTPREYQARMTAEILKHNVLLAAHPGLGKTAATADAIDQLVFDRFEVQQVLIVAPKIVASDTWPLELQKWDAFQRLTHRYWSAEDFGYEVQTTEIEGVVVSQKLRPADAAALKASVLSDKAVIHLVSRDNFYNLVLALGRDLPYGLLVLDESMAFSEPGSSRFKAVTAAQTVIPRTVLLNGTPLGNSLEKLWAQMCLVDGGAALGACQQMFRMQYMEPDKKNWGTGKVYSWKPQPSALGVVIDKCRGQLVALREEDWLTLPELIQKPVIVDIPRDDYERMERDLLLRLPDGAEALAVNAGVLYGKLSQMAGGIVFDTEKDWHETHRVKLEALVAIAEEHDGPLLIWTSYKPDISRIQKLLPGAVLASKAKNLEARWNRGEIPYLVAHPETLACGANLQDCPGGGMVWFNVTSNALYWNQGIKRIHRSGRTGSVICYTIAARDTVEDRMLERRLERSALEADLMDALAFRKTRASHPCVADPLQRSACPPGGAR